MTTSEPFILVIDDDDSQEAFALSLSKRGVEARHVLPEDLVLEDLQRATLLIIDEFLEYWPSRDRLIGSPGLYVSDGIALASVVRAVIEGRGPTPNGGSPRKTAIVLRTGALERLSEGLPRYLWSIAAAGRYDLEWVAEKSITAENLVLIARASAGLPSVWDPTAPQAQLKWLGLDSGPWSTEALQHIEQCRPPWSALSAGSAGRLWLAWMLQRILPFPTFLVDDLRAASYLGLEVQSLDTIISSGGEIGDLLSASLYKGFLVDFDGRRWWRAGVMALRSKILETSRGRGSDDVASKLAETLNIELKPLGLKHPVFAIDANYETVAIALDAVQAVRLQPDGWPSYADDPWLALDEIANEPELAKLIVIDDRAESQGLADKYE